MTSTHKTHHRQPENAAQHRPLYILQRQIAYPDGASRHAMPPNGTIFRNGSHDFEALMDVFVLDERLCCGRRRVVLVWYAATDSS